jgi:hypothetical protein
MNTEDLKLFVWCAEELAKHLARLSRFDRAQEVSHQIWNAHICYAVWKDGEGYRLRRLKATTPSRGKVKIIAGIPVDNEAHVDLLEAAASSHGAPSRICQ